MSASPKSAATALPASFFDVSMPNAPHALVAISLDAAEEEQFEFAYQIATTIQGLVEDFPTDEADQRLGHYIVEAITYLNAIVLGVLQIKALPAQLSNGGA